MDFDADSRLALDPQLCLKNDVDRAVILTRPAPLSDRENVLILAHPRDAVLLSLLDGVRTVSEVGRLWASLVDRPVEEAAEEVEKTLSSYSEVGGRAENIFVPVDEHDAQKIRRYDPMDFVIDRDKINLTDVRLRIPYHILYLPTLFCPQKCVYCYAKTVPAPERDLLPLERLRGIFEELRDLGVDGIGLSGGDPLARRDILDIIATILELGMTPDIPTKVGLSRHRIQKLQDMGIRLVQVSIDSAEPPVIDTMVGVAGYHRRVFRLLEDLRQLGMRVRVNSVMTPLNVRTLGGLIDYLGRLGNVFQMMVTPYGRSMFHHQDRLFLDEDLLQEAKDQIDAKRPLYPHMTINLSGSSLEILKSEDEKRRSWEDRSYCSANRQGFVILPDGRVTVCEELYDDPGFIIGDLRTQSVMEVWNSKRALELARPDQSSVPDGPCRTCDHFIECNTEKGRCWRDVLKAFGREKPHYPDPRCPLAPPSPRLS